jgi:hypothetical protein
MPAPHNCDDYLQRDTQRPVWAIRIMIGKEAARSGLQVLTRQSDNQANSISDTSRKAFIPTSHFQTRQTYDLGCGWQGRMRDISYSVLYCRSLNLTFGAGKLIKSRVKLFSVMTEAAFRP